MQVDPKKIAAAHLGVPVVSLNAAERLRLIEKLLDDVLGQLAPLTNARLCVVDGLVQAAAMSVEAAKDAVEEWRGKDLPVPGLDL